MSNISSGQLDDPLLVSVRHAVRRPFIDVMYTTGVILAGMEGPVSDQIRQDVEEIRAGLQQIESYVENILELVRIERAAPYDGPGNDLAIPLREACEQLEAVAQANNLQLVCNLPANLPAVKTDILAIRQAAQILLSNVIRFADEPIASISVQIADSFLTIHIHEGVRFKDDNRHIIQLPPERTEGMLALEYLIADRLIQHQGGQLTTSSDSEQTSISFDFSIPTSESDQ